MHIFFPYICVARLTGHFVLSFQFTDVDLDEFLPPIQELLDAPELGSLTESKSFQFLLKLIYEYFYDTYKKA